MAKSLWRNLARISIGVAFFCAVSVRANGLGGFSGAFLRGPVGANAAARGGALTANPAYACSWWNPAAIVTNRNKSLSAGGGYRSLGRTEGLAAFEFPIPPRVGMGLSVLYRGDPFLKDLYTGGPYANPEKEAEDGAYTSISFKIGLSYLVSRTVSAGLNISAYYQKMPTGFAGDDFTELEYSSASALGGFDLATRFKASNNLIFGLVFKNLLAGFDWVATGEDFGVPLTDILPPTLVAGSEYHARLLDKPFIWTADLSIYALESLSEAADHVQATLNNGFEWQYWDSFHIRAGVRDILLNRDMVAHPNRYWNGFSLAVTAGMRFDLSRIADGLHGNYALATDKIWAGVEQQLDLVYTF